MTNQLEELFPLLRLQPAHARVYLATLSGGTQPAAAIAQAAQVPRGTTYLLLEQLRRRGLVSVVKGETRLLFAATAPAKLQEILAERANDFRLAEKNLQHQLASLESLFTTHAFSWPKVRFYEGEGGLKTVYYDALAAGDLPAGKAGILVVCQGSPQTQTSLKDDPPYLKDFIRETMERKIPTRELLEDNPAVREYAAKYGSALHQILIMPRLLRQLTDSAGLAHQKQINAIGHVDKHLYGEKIAYISHDHLVGVIIEDATLAASERSLFAILWRHFSRPKKNPAQKE